MSEALVLYRIEDEVAVITLNRPEKMNALSREVWRDLDTAMVRADDDPAVRAIVLCGKGRAFCAGADLTPGEDPARMLVWWEAFQRHHARQFRMWESDKLLIAGVHGYCLGRGLELALWCDIVVAAEDTRIGQPEVREGWVVQSMVPWLIGPQQAKLFMLSGDVISAAEAHRLGLVARVVPIGSAEAAAIALARRLAHVPPVAARAVKRMVNGIYELQGIRAQQAEGIAIGAFTSHLSAEEKGTTEIERIRREQGLKASIAFRDEPFRE
jgi:enoyl-CoA hydratase/carnithine racemase